MKTLFQKYRSVVRFVVLFLGTYFLLSFLYAIYINGSKNGIYHPDYITHLVAKQSSALISEFGYTAQVIPHESQTSMKLFINQKFLARIIEGCNAISIIILFIAFVISFAQRFKITLLFIFGGAVLIYGINIFRIAILAIALYQYPQHEKILHSVVFPGIIYGMVFLLWMFWIRLISKTEKTI